MSKETVIPQWILKMIDDYYNSPERKLLQLMKKKIVFKTQEGR